MVIADILVVAAAAAAAATTTVSLLAIPTLPAPNSCPYPIHKRETRNELINFI